MNARRRGAQAVRALASARSVEVFCAAVDAGSFTAAATQLGMTPAGVSRAIARHEEALGATLLRRTTRRMALTDEGRAYYASCREALALLEAAERELADARAAPRGLVRVSAPTTYGHYRLVPFVADLAARYPEVEVELNVQNRNVDVVAEGYDLAIRMGELGSSSLTARKLEDASLGVFASPEYLARHPRPRAPDDLERHALLGFIRPSSGRVLPWLFRARDGAPFEVAPRARVRVSDDFLASIGLARAGAGLVQAYHFLVAAEVARGELVEVLKPFAGRTRPFTLLQPAAGAGGRRLAVRLFADELAAWCARASAR
jgi:DNA-binding transcriptional LysR family regulator